MDRWHFRLQISEIQPHGYVKVRACCYKGTEECRVDKRHRREPRLGHAVVQQQQNENRKLQHQEGFSSVWKRSLWDCGSRCCLIAETSPCCILLQPYFYIWSSGHTACSNLPVREELSYFCSSSKLKGFNDALGGVKFLSQRVATLWGDDIKMKHHGLDFRDPTSHFVCLVIFFISLLYLIWAWELH